MNYARRRPEESVLYEVVRAGLETFLSRAREQDRVVPRFVERELRAYLGCGILASGYGYVWWGLSKPPRPPRDPLAALERAWERYHGNVTALAKEGVTDENRAKVLTTIEKHVQTIESLREKVA